MADKFLKKLLPELQQKAIVELNEVLERIPEDIQYIKDWLKTQPYINARLEDRWLLIFLRGSKFRLERTKQKLDEYYMSKTLIPEFRSNRDPFLPEIQRLLKKGVYLPLLKTDNPASPIIVLFRNAAYDLNEDTCENILKVYLMIMEILMNENDNIIIAGHTTVGDAKNVTLAHYALSPRVMEKLFTMYQRSLPLRVKGLYYINSTVTMEKCFNIIKPFISHKIRDRVKFFPEAKMEEFYKEYPQKLLPREYGGDAGSIADLIEFWKNKVESYAGWFEDGSKYCTNENLRPGKPKTLLDVFAMEGSFRRLNVD